MQRSGASCWYYERSLGIRYGTMLQSLLQRRFFEHDETDIERETEQQEDDSISDAVKHGIVCGG